MIRTTAVFRFWKCGIFNQLMLLMVLNKNPLSVKQKRPFFDIMEALKGGFPMYIIVEDKIKEAIENGDFDNLPGKGKKLNVRDELPGLSPELNQAYKILKNAGFVPEEGNDKQSGKDMSTDDLMTYATGEEYKDEAKKSKQFDDLVKKRKLHRNPKFPFYRKKVFKKLS